MNETKVQFLRELLEQLENDARCGQVNLCGILAVQASLIKELEKQLDEKKVA